AATSLHAQDARQSLAVNGDRDEIVAGRDLVRRAAESAEPTATRGGATKCLRHEAERAKPTAAATSASLTRFAEQVAEGRQEGRVGRCVARFAAALAAGRRQHRPRRRGAWRGLTGPLV